MNHVFFWVALLFFGFSLQAQDAIRLNLVTRGLSIPVYLTHAGDDRLFILEKQGRIRIIRNGTLSPVPFLNIVSKVNSRGNEQGLLGLAFHPDYGKNGLFYINYSAPGTGNTIVAEYRVRSDDPQRADSLSERVLMNIPQPFTNHNGGCMHFGKDGYLYIGMGDGGSGGDPQNLSQNPKSLLGKMLRIDVDTSSSYRIPVSNPYRSSTTFLPEIWASGLRNPWRFSFDRLTGDMWIGDVGQGEWEEVNFQNADSKGGENYGWRCYEGKADYNTSGCAPRSNYDFPVYDYRSDDSQLGCSVTGGYVYRENPGSYLYGTYIYGDYCSGFIWGMTRDSLGRVTNRNLMRTGRNQVASFGEDLSGALYLIAIAEGAVYRISDTCQLRVQQAVWDPSCSGKDDGVIELISNTPGSSFSWSTGDTTSRIEGLRAGSYTVTVTSGTCRVVQSINLISPPVKTACIVPILRSEICESDSLLLEACPDSSAVKFHWYRDSTLISGLSGNKVYVRIPGRYTLRFEDSLGCLSEGSSEIDLIVHANPGKPLIILSGDSLLAVPGYDLYRWYRDGQLIAEGKEPFYLLDKKGVYELVVADSKNCESPKSDPVLAIPSSAGWQTKNDQLKLFPNPGSGLYHLEGLEGLEPPFQLKVTSVTGHLMLLKNSSDIGVLRKLDLRSIPNGTYWLTLSTGRGELKPVKLIKEE